MIASYAVPKTMPQNGANGAPPNVESYAQVRADGRLPDYLPALGQAFMRVTGADPNHFRLSDGTGIVPPTYYVTWAMAAMADTLTRADLHYAYARALHAGSEVEYKRPRFLFRLKGKGDMLLEKWALAAKRDMFESVFDANVVVEDLAN